MSVGYCTYPSLKGKSHLCGYKIATDRLASILSVARHHTRHIPQGDPLQLMGMIYHADRPIRRACAIGEAELKKLNTFYARCHIGMDRFVLPGGYIDASYLRVLRVEVEAVIRIMHQTQCREKPAEATLFNFMNLLSNTFFMMRLYENAQDDIREREFISRSCV